MTSMKRLAVALVAVLSLSACAVTGQPARPGTAATYDGATITTAQVAAWGTAQNAMGYSYDPGATLSLLLMRPSLEAEAAVEGIVFSDDQIASDAQLWMGASANPNVVTPTPDMIDVVRLVHTFHALAGTETGAASITQDLKSIAANAHVNPMYGKFTYEQFINSATALAQAQKDNTAKYGPVSYLVFKEVSGFELQANREWMVPEGATSTAPPVTPSPAP